MQKRKFGFLLSGIMAASFMVTACGGGQQPAETSKPAETKPAEQTQAEAPKDGQTFVFKAGHSLTEEHPYNQALKKMAEEVEKKTNGKVKIEVYPLSALGAERELTEALTFGTADMSITSTAPVTNFVPKMGVLDLPFLFESREQAYKVLDGKVGQDLLKELESANLIGLAWAENGFRHITNGAKDIKKPEDLKGIKIRTQENQIHLAAFEALGAKPTPMAWTEALTALQQGVVDAQENPAIVADTYKLYEAKQTHMSLSGHVYSAALLLFSKPVWDKLPADVQQVLAEEAKAAGQYERELMIKMEEEALKNLKDKGIVIVEDVDKQAFRDAIKPVYDKYAGQFGQELIDEILNTK